MPNEVKQQLDKSVGAIIQVLETAPRMGERTDEPEGSRYIQFSDTLALRLARDLREFLANVQ